MKHPGGVGERGKRSSVLRVYIKRQNISPGVRDENQARDSRTRQNGCVRLTLAIRSVLTHILLPRSKTHNRDTKAEPCDVSLSQSARPRDEKTSQLRYSL